MFDLFGSELPLAARFFIAFLVVLALIGLTAWVVRRFGANRLGGAGARGRQPRLAVIDAASVDGRRRLVLIRRDNIEHLLMIGGPTDVVIEPNIVRAASGRDTAREPARPAAPSEPAVRAVSAAETAWPLQPASEPPPVASPRPHRAPATEEPWLPPEPGGRPRPPDSLSGLAAELSSKLTPPPEPTVPAVERPEPRVTTPAEPAPAERADDHNLAEMAQQLEAALRRAPLSEGRPPVTDPLATQAHAPKPSPEVKPPEPKVEPRVEAKRFSRPEPKIAPKVEPAIEPKIEPKIEKKPDVKLEHKPGPASASDKNLYDNLEEEMASLLGRPSGKS